MRVPTRYEEDEEISRGEGSEFDVERSHQGVSVHQSPAGVEQGQGDEDVLQAVDDDQIFVFSLHSQPLPGVVVLTIILVPVLVPVPVPVSEDLRSHYSGQITQNNCESFLQIKIRAVIQNSLKDF